MFIFAIDFDSTFCLILPPLKSLKPLEILNSFDGTPNLQRVVLLHTLSVKNGPSASTLIFGFLPHGSAENSLLAEPIFDLSLTNPSKPVCIDSSISWIFFFRLEFSIFISRISRLNSCFKALSSS